MYLALPCSLSASHAELKSQRVWEEAHLALGLRNAFANSKANTSRERSQPRQPYSEATNIGIGTMQLVISFNYKPSSPFAACFVPSLLHYPLSPIHLLTIQTPFLQADVDSR